MIHKNILVATHIYLNEIGTENVQMQLLSTYIVFNFRGNDTKM